MDNEMLMNEEVMEAVEDVVVNDWSGTVKVAGLAAGGLIIGVLTYKYLVPFVKKQINKRKESKVEIIDASEAPETKDVGSEEV